MAIPAGVETVTLTDGGVPITGPDGTVLDGYLTLTGPDLATVREDDFVFGGYARRPVTAGRFDPVTLVATDATGLDPSGGTYSITFKPLRGNEWTRYLTLPKASPAVALADVLLPDPVAGAYATLVDPAGLLSKAANLADVANASTARANLGAYDASAGAVLEQRQPDLPSDQGLLAWTYDPNMAGHVTAQSSSGVAGRITLVRIILRRQILWSNIWIGLAGADAAAVLSNCYLGVYDSAGTLKASTADISSSLMSGTTAKPLALTAPFTAVAGTYFIAMLLNGTWTTNSLTFKASGAGVSVNAGLTAPGLRYSNLLSSQTSLPASLNLTGQSTSIINTGWASQWYGVN